MEEVCADAEMAALLARAQKGDRTAYDRLYDLYADKIFRYLYARLGEREAAEDLTADVFVRLVQALPRFRVNAARPVASFSAWLYRIADNLLTDYRRRRRFRQHEALDHQRDLPAQRPDPFQHAATGERSRLLAAAIARLGEEQQRVIVHRFLEERSLTEAAELMGKTVGGIKALQHRALAHLRQVLVAEEIL